MHGVKTVPLTKVKITRSRIKGKMPRNLITWGIPYDKPRDSAQEIMISHIAG